MEETPGQTKIISHQLHQGRKKAQKPSQTHPITVSQWMGDESQPGKQAPFPKGVLFTTLRLDVVIWSTEGRKIIMVELTTPWEEGCKEAAEWKTSKYQQLVNDCRDKGWQTWLYENSDEFFTLLTSTY